MSICPRPLLLALCGLAAACAATPPTDPDALPLRLVPVTELGRQVMTVDLDGDRRDEVVRYDEPAGLPPGNRAVLLTTHEGELIEQVNFEGKVWRPHALDVTGDGVLELLVPLQRNDSLFVTVLDARGQKRFTFLLARGQPRVEPDGLIGWDPRVRDFFTAEVEGRASLVSVLFTGYARAPRGVFVHALPDGHLLGKQEVGAAVGQSILDDFDDDGRPELVAVSSATDNGADAAGVSDRHAHLLLFRVGAPPQLAWSETMGGKGVFGGLEYGDFDGDGDRELWVMEHAPVKTGEEVRLRLIEPGSWRTLRQRTMAEPLVHPLVLDLDRDAQPEMVVIRSPDEVWVFDSRFERVRQRTFPVRLTLLQTVPDADDDGVGELVAQALPYHLFLTDDLDVKAAVEAEEVVGVMRRGIGARPHVLLRQNGHVWAYEMTPNPLYLVHRHGPGALWVLGLGLLLGLGLMVGRTYREAARVRRRNAVLRRTQALAFDTDPRGLCFLDAEGRIIQPNATLRRWLGHDDACPPDPEVAFADAPELLDAIRERAAAPAPPAARRLHLQLGGRPHSLEVRVEPVVDAGSGLRRMVILRDTTAAERGALGAQLARRTAHEVADALGPLLESARKLRQAAHGERPPDVADLGCYAERVLHVAEGLDRLTQRLPKLLDETESEPIETDLDAFVAGSAAVLRQELPAGVRLETRPAPRPCPPVRLDPELMHVALRHLVRNAAQAMPTGGLIVLATMPGGQRTQGEAPRPPDGDPRHLVLDVHDTGTGIAPADLPYVFEPGFSTAEQGWGLGLPLVRQVVERHGGRIEVESSSSGTRFRIVLPVLSGPHSSPPQPHASG